MDDYIINMIIAESFDIAVREESHIDFVHEKRHMDVGGGERVAPVTFLGEKSWKILIV